MKESAKYLAAMIGFLLLALVLSWFAVFGFWYAALWFHSVAAVRLADTVGSIILVPVRFVFWCFPDFVDQSTPLIEPARYAFMNAGLLGLLSYFCCRDRLFGRRRRP